MALIRGVSKMSLGTWGRKASKYQKFINVSNVFLAITSLILVFIAVVLMRVYHLDKLHFWSTSFVVTPYLMAALGLFSFAICIFGCLISNHESRPTLIIMAILLSIAFLFQLALIYLAMDVKTQVDIENIPYNDMYSDMKNYGLEGYEDVTSRWDTLQFEMGCCGGEGWNTGFLGWSKSKIYDRGFPVSQGGRTHVPDSCCHERVKNCGLLDDNTKDVNFYRDGCVTMLEIKLKYDVVPIMYVVAIIGVILAIVKVITIALACAYVAQISRREKAEDMFSRPADANGEDYPPLTSRGETAF
jgi:hypothetical protein